MATKQTLVFRDRGSWRVGVWRGVGKWYSVTPDYYRTRREAREAAKMVNNAACRC